MQLLQQKNTVHCFLELILVLGLRVVVETFWRQQSEVHTGGTPHNRSDRRTSRLFAKKRFNGPPRDKETLQDGRWKEEATRAQVVEHATGPLADGGSSRNVVAAAEEAALQAGAKQSVRHLRGSAP